MTDPMDLYYAISNIEVKMIIRDDDGNLSYMEALFLNIIRRMDDCTASKIAGMLNLTRSAVTIRINSLVRKGLVVRKPSIADGRVKYIELSDYAKSKFAEEEDLINGALSVLSDEYRPDEMQLFSDMMGSLVGTIKGLDPNRTVY